MSGNKPVPRIAVLAFGLLLAPPAWAQAPDPVIAQAEASGQAGGPTAPADLAALFDALRTSHDPIRQIQLIDAIGRLGGSSGGSSPLSRTIVRANAPAVLIATIGSPDADWSARGEALHCLRTIDAPDAAVAMAVAAAQATTGEHAGYLHSQAIALRTWRDNQDNAAGAAPKDDADAVRRARLFLHQQDASVSTDSLSDALGKGRSDIVAALLIAGLPVGGADAARGNIAVINGLSSACEATPVPVDGVGRSLALLVSAGLTVNYADQSGNTLLMSAAQFCPAPIAAQLLALGAAVGPVNKQHFTPLQMALVSGKWDVAKVLVDHGARITRHEADQIFFEAPQEQAQRDLLARATQ